MTPAEFRAARLSLGLTQAQLAEWLGYGDKMRVSDIERGVRDPGATVVILMEAYLSGWRRAALSGKETAL
jgi:transcriptional regulator with XRE-family HTH domain